MRFWRRSQRSFGLLGGLTALAISWSIPSYAFSASDDDLGFLTAILRNGDVSTSVRTDAAIRLLRLGGTVSDEALAESLRSGDPAQVEAVARALALDGVPRLLVAEALIEALATSTPDVGSLAGLSLARLGDEQVASIVPIAENMELEKGARVGAIRALAAFESRRAVSALVVLLQNATTPEEVTAVTAALRQITRIDLGASPERWSAWWTAVGDMPLEQAIGAASADRERQLEEQGARITELEMERARIGKRLQAILGAWIVTLSEEDREVKVREMLEDELVHVRQFAGSQVQRMLRNGVSPQQATIDAVTRRLDDEDGSIRGLAAQLLAAMRVEGLAERLAKEVADEQDSAVAALMLEQIALRPSPDAFTPTLARLDDAVTAGAAAKALSRLVAEGMVPDDWAEQALGGIRRLHAETRTPAIAALLVLAGQPEDLQLATKDLDDDSIAVRRASAFAFVSRGMYEEVARRGGDEGVRPAAIQALVLMPPTRIHLQQLLAIEPAESELPAWRDAVRTMAVRFPLSDRLEVDGLLASDERISAKLRAGLLDAAQANLSLESMDETGFALLTRYTDLLVIDNRWQEVAEALSRPTFSLNEQLTMRLFTARIRLGDFDGAAMLESSPQVWFELLDGTIDVAPAEAASIAAEINARFDQQLNDEQRARLADISKKLAIANGTEERPDGG